ACKGRLELSLICTRIVGAVARDEPVLVAEPLPVDVDRIIELGRPDLGEKPRLEHVGDECLAGSGDDRLLAWRRLVSGAPANVDPTAPGHGCSSGNVPRNFYSADSAGRNSDQAPGATRPR